MKNIISEVINNFLNKECINEINYIAKNSPITICSLDDFFSVCESLNVNDSNVENLYGKYCFIEIGSTKDRCMYDSHLTLGYEKYDNDGERYFNEQFFFKKEHKNVIKLIFDDILSVKKDANGLTKVKLTNDNFRQGADIKKLPNVKKTNVKGHFSYPNAKAFSVELAEKAHSFIEDNISNSNGDIKFVIHCREGKSRSAAMGYYIAKRLKLDIQKYLSEYEMDKTFVNDKNNDIRTVRSTQFKLGHDGMGKSNKMNHRVSTIMNAVNSVKNGDYEQKVYDKYNVLGGENDMPQLWANEKPFYDDLNSYIGDKDNPKIFNKLKGYKQK